MADFIIELHLRWHGLRQEAELALYILLVATKHHYKKSTAVHTFARLMDLLNELNCNAAIVSYHEATAMFTTAYTRSTLLAITSRHIQHQSPGHSLSAGAAVHATQTAQEGQAGRC
eukprot:11156-Heterococcus_DN1.PRE.3